MHTRTIAPWALITILSACADDPRRLDPPPRELDAATSPDDGGAPDLDGGHLPPDPPAPGAPRILSFRANNTVMMPGERLVLTLLATDPDGIDDLIGGSLLDPVSGGSYGALATAAAEGAYEVVLDWDMIGHVRPIRGPVTGEARTFRAELFDAAGHAAQADLVVSLRCARANEGPCDNRCRRLDTASDCGACGLRCEPIRDGAWGSGCFDARCYDAFASRDRISGDAVCAALGLRCLDAEAAYGDRPEWDPYPTRLACSEQPPAESGPQPFGEVRALCE